jgi:hypothetical protein
VFENKITESGGLTKDFWRGSEEIERRRDDGRSKEDEEDEDGEERFVCKVRDLCLAIGTRSRVCGVTEKR